MKDMLREIIQNGRSTPGPKLSNDVEVVMVKPIAARKAKKKNAKK